MLHKKQFARGAGISVALAFAVLAAGCGGHGATNYAPVANFQIGQPNWNNTTANRGLNNIAAANSLNSPGNAATNANVAATPAAVKFYIADTGNNRVLGFNSLPTNGNAMADFVIGQSSLTGNLPGFSDGSSTALALSAPTKVAISPDGSKLLVVDSSNNRVLIWNSLPTSNVKPDIILGGNTSTTTLDGTTLNAPFGATFAPNSSNPSRVIVADTGNNRVLVFNAPTTGGSANFVIGQRGLGATPASGGAGAATGNSANCPQVTSSITIACDNSNFQVGADTVASPGDVTSDGFKLVVADTGNGRVLYYPTMPVASATTPTVSATQASYVMGATVMTTRTTSGGGAAGFTTPSAVWLDTSNIYVADSGNNRVLAFRYPVSNGTSAVSVYGQGDFVHVTANDDDQNNVSDKDCCGRPQASDRTLFAPAGMVTLGNSGSSLIYVLDSGNSRMMVFNTY